MATIAIIGALEKEIMQIKEELSNVCMVQEAGLNVVTGGLDGLTVVATTAGMGTVNAAAATQHLISKYAPQAVVFSGIAGGLNPKLHIDDVVIGKRLRYLDTDTALIAESAPGLEEFGSTPALVDIAADVLAERGFVDASTNAAASNEGTKQFLVGTIATGNRFVTGAAMRNDAIEATHADCVGMEARRLPMSQLKMVSIAWCCALSAIIVTRRTMRFATASSTCSSMPVPRVALRSISFAVSLLSISALFCKNLRPRSVHGRFH